MSKWKTILVGVDGSPHSRSALRWAAAEAAEHGADLVVLNAWHSSLPTPMGLGSASHVVPDARQDATESLVSVIKDELGDNPSVLVQPRVEEGSPAKLLIELSTDADLLVVGARGHGGFAGLILGSVAQHVAAYAQCPVAVIR